MAPERRTELLSLAKQEQEVRLRQVPPVIADRVGAGIAGIQTR